MCAKKTTAQDDDNNNNNNNHSNKTAKLNKSSECGAVKKTKTKNQNAAK
jgi:hypothetical protein